MNVEIVLDKTSLTKSVETLLWKYGNAIEGADNFKQVSNVKTDTVNDKADKRLLDDSYAKRVNKAADIMREYVTDVEGSVIRLALPNNWGGDQKVLKTLVEDYVTNGMMVDWLNPTAPNEAALYGVALKDAEQSVKSEIYAIGVPK